MANVTYGPVAPEGVQLYRLDARSAKAGTWYVRVLQPVTSKFRCQKGGEKKTVMGVVGGGVVSLVRGG